MAASSSTKNDTKGTVTFVSFFLTHKTMTDLRLQIVFVFNRKYKLLTR